MFSILQKINWDGWNVKVILPSVIFHFGIKMFCETTDEIEKCHIPTSVKFPSYNL